MPEGHALLFSDAFRGTLRFSPATHFHSDSVDFQAQGLVPVPSPEENSFNPISFSCMTLRPNRV
jgi:hypothetical protein